MVVRLGVVWLIAVLAGACAAAAAPSAGTSTTPGATNPPTQAVEPSAMPTLAPTASTAPTTKPTLAPTTKPTGSPSPAPAMTELPGLWDPADPSDSELADRVNEAWTDNDVGLFETLYADPAWLLTGWNLAESMDRAGMRTAVGGTPNTYVRIGPVTVRVDGVPGLIPVGAGGRYLHFVDVIHSNRFDVVLEVNDAGKVVRQYVDGWVDAATRLEWGFPNFAPPDRTPPPG